MKNFIMLVCVSILFCSCFPKTFSELKENEYERYLEFRTETYSSTTRTAFDGSPLSYSVLKGKNDLADYDWKIVRLRDWYNTYYASDPTLLIDKVCPDSDVILGYNTYYYIGTKKETK